jgi:hypothetical protein
VTGHVSRTRVLLSLVEGYGENAPIILDLREGSKLLLVDHVIYSTYRYGLEEVTP